MPLKCIGSPNWMADRTFTLTVYFVDKSPKPEPPRKKHRNPIHLAKEYVRMIETGEAKSESDLARKLNISRVHVNHITRLLKLNTEIMKAIEQLGDPLTSQVVTERMLRPFVDSQGSKIENLLMKLNSGNPL